MAMLKASTRNELGTRQVRRLREKGLIPGVIYGHKKDVVSVTLSEHDVELILQHGERLLEVDVDGRKENVLVKDVQWDTFGKVVLHVDLCRVDLDERVQVTVSVLLRGTPASAGEGGVLQQAVADINVDCRVDAIPDEIRILINHMNTGDTLYLRDVPLADGVTLLDDPDAVLCTVMVVAEEEEPEAEEGEDAAEPEVIGKKAEEGEQDGAGE
jgi:large subunit ribosomal protein L25